MKYFDFETKSILSENDMLKQYEQLVAETEDPADLSVSSFAEYLETAIEWQDVLQLDDDDMEKLNSEKCYFCKDTNEIITESFLREQFERYDYMKNDYETFEEFISAQTAPWESLVEMN